MVRFADRVAVSFTETKDSLKINKDRIVFTGNPVRPNLVKRPRSQAIDYFGLEHSKFTILVMGGSQGSQRVNHSFLRAISAISAKDKIQIIHLCGQKDLEFLKDSYRKLQIEARVFVFLEDMQYAYNACDMVLSRAGAATLSEIIFFKLPAVIIPYPFAYKHQLANAAAIEGAGAGLVIQDSDLDSDILLDTINDLIGDLSKINKMRLAYDNISGNNAEMSLVESALGLIKFG